MIKEALSGIIYYKRVLTEVYIAQRRLPEKADLNTRIGVTSQAFIEADKKLDPDPDRDKLIDDYWALANGALFKLSPFALNEFAHQFWRLSAYDKALNLYSRSATEYPTDTPINKQSQRKVRDNLCIASNEVSYMGIQRARQLDGEDDAIHLFRLVFEATDSYLQKYPDDEAIKNARLTAEHGLNNPKALPGIIIASVHIDMDKLFPKPSNN